MNAAKLSWTNLQRQEGARFLQWIDDNQALRTGFIALANALQEMLEDCVRTRKDACDLWGAVPDVIRRCNDLKTYCKPKAAPAYAWLHFLERYVRTWLALQKLVKQNLLPMGKEGVRALDVGTGPGPSAFATHDFYAAMVEYAEFSGNKHWRQPPRLTCVEAAGAMNHFRHLLAEKLFEQGAPESVLAMCGNIQNFKSIHPRQERKELSEGLLNEYENYYDEGSDAWHSEPLYTPNEANYIANNQHRYRLFTISNFLTELSDVECYRQNLTNILTDAHLGSVLLVIGTTGRHYPKIYKKVAALARDARFSQNAEDLRVSISHAGMGDSVYSEGARFYRRLKYLAGDFPNNNRCAKDNCCARTVKAHFEGEKVKNPSKSAVHAYRK